MLDGTDLGEARAPRVSLLARPAWARVLAVLLGLVPLWLAVAWAVAAP